MELAVRNLSSDDSLLIEECFEKVSQSISEGENTRDSVDDNQLNDYYEVISADGSIGEDDPVGVVDITKELLLKSNSNNCLHAKDIRLPVFKGASLNKTYSFNNLPFVPKFECSQDQIEINDVTNYKALPRDFVKNPKFRIPRPDKNFTIPPPNFSLLLNDRPHDFANHLLTSEIQEPITELVENINTESERKIERVKNICVSEATALINCQEKSHIVDWLDENGDPIPGAFDFVKPEDEPNLDKSSKIEYVFSVREKKDINCENSDVVNSGIVIQQNLLHKNIAENVGVLIEGQLLSDATYIFKDDEEKKLYEASKSGAEYKAAVEAASSAIVFTKIDSANKNQIPRFRRNRFTDIKKEEESTSQEMLEDQPVKSTEEVALERYIHHRFHFVSV